MPRPWSFRPHDPAAIGRLSRALKLPPLVAQVLVARGMTTAQAASDFLRSPLSKLRDPSLLPGIDQAADRIVEAMKSGRRITVYGDYDVDGVTGTSILWHCLSLAGARQVDYYIPCRMEEGYGLNRDAVCQLHDEDPDRLLISVDCGIASIAEAELAAERGLELIITDHHQIGPTLPPAACLVHPRLPGTASPFGDLCGAGVAFKLAWAVCQRLGDGRRASPKMRQFLTSAVGLAAIGTVADVVPLIDENRVLVKHGLKCVREDPSTGLRALLKVAGLADKSQFSAEDIGFALAPRINAAGRLGQARLAVELLTTSDAERAVVLAEYLEQLNDNRRTVERRVLRDARKQMEQHPEWLEQPVLVLAGRDWHPGVIGIVASRMAEQFEKPAILIALKDDGSGQGSARSWAGFDLHAALEGCADTLLAFGGHRAAAGLKVRASDVDRFRDAVTAWAAEHFQPQESDLALDIDAEVLLSEVTRQAVQELDRLGPFGERNPAPRFAATGVRLVEPPRTMGDGDRHLSLRIRQNGTALRAVAFGRGDWAEQIAAVDGPLSVSFAPVINSFRGLNRVELRLIDWKPAGDS